MGKQAARCVLAGVVLSFLWLGACSSSGSSAIDLDGTFSWSVTIAQTTCGGPAGEVRTDTLSIVQSGTNVTILFPMTGEPDIPISGTLEGSSLHASGTYADPPWSLVLDITATAGDGGASLEGLMNFAWVNAGTQETCAESGPFTATKI